MLLEQQRLMKQRTYTIN